MAFYQYPDYMYHYGVLGMKWGQRRAKVKQAIKIKRNSRAYKKSVKEFYKITASAHRRGVKPGTVITSKTGTKVEITEAGAKWLTANKKVQQMPIEDLLDAMFSDDPVRYKGFHPK